MQGANLFAPVGRRKTFRYLPKENRKVPADVIGDFLSPTKFMNSFILIFVLASIGIIEAIYLIRKRLASEKPICPIGGDCAIVLDSKYNKIFFVHNDILGLLTYIIILCMSALLILEIEPISLWSLILQIMVALAAITSVFFTYLQWHVVKNWCFWCLMSACTTWLMGIIILISGNI